MIIQSNTGNAPRIALQYWINYLKQQVLTMAISYYFLYNIIYFLHKHKVYYH